MLSQRSEFHVNNEHPNSAPSAARITKGLLEHLADLARLELQESEKEKFLKDLGKILDYFKELQELNTENIQPMAGGTELKNILREDEKVRDKTRETRKAVEAFPEEEKGYLKVPPVFE